MKTMFTLKNLFAPSVWRKHRETPGSMARLAMMAVLLASGAASAVAQESMEQVVPDLSKLAQDVRVASKTPAASPAKVVKRVPGAPKTAEWYSQFTYTWTDGSQVTHTSNITEKATDPYQITALLEEIYTNTQIPGTITLPENESGSSNFTVDYNGYSWRVQYQSWPYNYETRTVNRSWYDWYVHAYNITDGYYRVNPTLVNDYTPDEDGLTVLLVEVKDDAPGTGQGSTFADFVNNLKSVQLITSAVRIEDSANPRTIVTVQGDLNRFYFISKGKKRNAIDMLFEEFSPTATSTGSETADLYQKLAAGEAYTVQHDCNDIVFTEHYFSMSGRAGTEPKEVNICLSIPDKRLTNWSGRAFSSTLDYVNYNPNYAPTVMMYTVSLTATAAPLVSDPEHYYLAKLDWTNSFSGDVSSLTERYEVYLVGDDGEPMGDPIYVSTEDMATTDNEGRQNYYYNIERIANKSTNLTYVVKAVTSTGMEVWSNHASIHVPGNPPEAEFMISANLNSTYDSNAEVNNYTATVLLENEQGAEFDYRPIAKAYDNEHFRLVRTDDYGHSDVVAVMDLTAVGGNEYLYDYTVTYTDGRTATGRLNHSTSTLEFGDGIEFTDIFSASTVTNEQPEVYHYRVYFTYTMPGETDDDEHVEVSMASNMENVQVLKTDPEVNAAFTYSLNQVLAENGNEPTLQPGTQDVVEFAVSNNVSILYYNVMRDGERVGYAQHTQDGNYTSFGLNKDGELVAGASGQSGTATVNVAWGDEPESHVWWIEIVRRNSDDDGQSTFGTQHIDTERGEVSMTTIKANTSVSSAQGITSIYRGLKKDIATVLSSTAHLAGNVGDQAYRLWRKVGSDSWQLVPLRWDVTSATTGSENGWDWIDVIDEITFQQYDAFASASAAEGLEVQYVLHAYVTNATNPNQDAAGAPALPTHYTVAEAKLSYTFNSDEVTGVTTVDASQQNGPVQVFSTDGRMVYSGDAAGMALPRGIWVVRDSSGRSYKVVK